MSTPDSAKGKNPKNETGQMTHSQYSIERKNNRLYVRWSGSVSKFTTETFVEVDGKLQKQSVHFLNLPEGCDWVRPVDDIRALAAQIWTREAAVETGIPAPLLKILFITRKTD